MNTRNLLLKALPFSMAFLLAPMAYGDDQNKEMDHKSTHHKKHEEKKSSHEDKDTAKTDMASNGTPNASDMMTKQD